MKTIVVLGATGDYNKLLTHSTYRIRAVTRNLTPPKALALSQQGIEVVPGDFNDKASLISAFQGASAIYAVTDFWAPFIGGLSASEAQALETRHGKNIVDAALVIPNLEHFIWSTLQSAKHKGGDIAVNFVDGKDDVDKYIKNSPLLSKTTFLWIGFYAQNLHWAPMMVTKLIQAGKTTYAHLFPTPPNTPIPFIEHKSDLGPIVYVILVQPEKTLNGRYVLATNGEDLTVGQMFKLWAESAGVKDLKYIQITEEVYGVLHGKTGLEISSELEVWSKYGAGSGNVEALSPSDLGLSKGKSIREYLESQDWSGYL